MMPTDPKGQRPVVVNAPDWLQVLAKRTNARVALGRAGTGMPTRPLLAFALDHARARDAVHSSLDCAGLGQGLAALGLRSMVGTTRAEDRAIYLTRPDLGRQLSEASEKLLQAQPQGAPLVIVVGDGLSANAANMGALPLIAALLERLPEQTAQQVLVVLVEQCRVAAGDPVCKRWARKR